MTRNETHEPRRDASGGAPAKGERQRIAKRMARAGLCSRRDAEAWITGGRVKVNGEVLSSPARDVGPEDVILVDDAPLPTAEKTRLFMFHKPRGLVTSDHDPEGRETVADFLRENWPEGPRVVTIGRLDINTEGLLLLTNDGGLARVLELPETGWLRRYRVRAKGTTDQAVLDALAAGIELDGIDYAGIDAKLDRIQGSNCWLTMGLREGKNREIKRVLEHVGLEVNRLIRVSFGPFQLLDLPDGAVEEVRTRVLRDQLGDALAAAAGVDLADRNIAPPTPERAPPIARGDGDRPWARQAVEKRDTPDREAALDPDRRLSRPKGPRRHVSTLRAGNATAAVDGPRKRVERTSTRDRHDRVVAVERVMTRELPARPSAARTEARKGTRPGGTRSGEKAASVRRRKPSAPASRAAAVARGPTRAGGSPGAGLRARGASIGETSRTLVSSGSRVSAARPRGRNEEMRDPRKNGAGGDRSPRTGGFFDGRPREGARGRGPTGSGAGQGRDERARRGEGSGGDERQSRGSQHARRPDDKGARAPRPKPGGAFRERPKGPPSPRSGRPAGGRPAVDRPRPRPAGSPPGKPPRGAPRGGPRGKPKR